MERCIVGIVAYFGLKASPIPLTHLRDALRAIPYHYRFTVPFPIRFHHLIIFPSHFRCLGLFLSYDELARLVFRLTF